MSHTSTVKAIAISNIDALRAAIEEMNQQGGLRISLKENATPRAYYAGQEGMGNADFVVALEDARYDIGLYKNGKGGYEARTDWFGGSVERVLGAPATSAESADQARMGKLFQMYGIHAATAQARHEGRMVRRLAREDGTVALEVTGFDD